MKKVLFISLLLSIFSVTGCVNNTKNSQEIDNQDNVDQSSINETLKTIVHNHELYYLDNEELFVDIAILGSSVNNKGNTEYYLVSNGESFKIDERGNLANLGGFGNIPTKIELSQDENGYNLINYEVAKDGNEYDSSTKEMFSEEAYKIRKDGKYAFINDKSLLQQAEEYFNVTIIPEEKNDFECSFCDKLRYYDRTPEDDQTLTETNELHFNYTTTDNGKNTIYFGSDKSFEAKGSWDAGKGAWTFGKDGNTIIVENENLLHVFDRYIIINQTEDSLNTILEIIQRR